MSNLPDGLAQFEFAKLQLLNHLNSLSDTMRKCAEISDQYAHVLHSLGPATLQVIQPMPPMGSPFAAGPPMGVNPQLNMKQMMPPPQQLPMVPGQPNGVGKRKSDHTQEGEVVKKRRVKKPRDPDAPKRPPSSYLLFQNEVRQAMKRANPSMANHEILTNISQRWAQMRPEEKETYSRRQEEAKAVYKQEKLDYDAMKAGVAVPVQVTEPTPGVGDRRSTKKKTDITVAASSEDSAASSSDSSEDSSDDDDDEEEKPPVVVPAKEKKHKKSSSTPQSQNPPAKQKVPAQPEKKEKKRKTKE
ncbi:hypothetical protein BJ322DRAFT_1075684 [Thelephora terrestris]|uniref:HMG box domain-containing protein n=1 Tax=Thelephora terrestris TaxID=56493 RepID=A0A9P6L4S2_9AGAM|nr:hypothetical protein BJ322DRAFT_1075684 [Thelephora terrestris]